jgi:hypothetical protein
MHRDRVSFTRCIDWLKSMSAPVCVPDAAVGQRQILSDLAAEYGRQLRQILQVGELIKGSVYQIEPRCGNPGMHRWVGLGVIADNLINIGRVLTQRLTPKKSASDAP